MNERDILTVNDVDTVFHTMLLGPSGQNDLVHYESRLKDTLGYDNYRIAMEILAEAATQGSFSHSAKYCLEGLYAHMISDVASHISDVLEVLVHDGYLEPTDSGFSFPSRLLKEWWAARFRDHYTPLEERWNERD